MPLAEFHPVVRRWFEGRFEAPTAPQRRGWEAIRSGRHTLISAPTGSGKTLAAFLSAIDDLLREGLERASAPPSDGDASSPLPDETRVLYISPLRALGADIHRNLAEPRKEMRRIAKAMELPPVRITAAVRSGDTPRSERRAMLRTPPHILVTTPESLYLLLTARKSREMLRTVETVIVDEIHAVLDSRRGSHLALSLERLAHVVDGPLQRIGCSATQHPIEEVGRFLVGSRGVDADGRPDCVIVDEGHRQSFDLALELPESPLDAVTSGETWDEIVERLAALIAAHRTTLVFVNTRREAERLAHRLTERMAADGAAASHAGEGGDAESAVDALGPDREDEISAHHGSLSKETRLAAERRLKEGRLRALVATASMELGIDIGHVDLACQIGSPKRIATFLQRVGRSGHTVRGTPKGRLFPLTRDDLVECAALLWAVRRGELDRVEILPEPLDVLSQQIVAEVAAEETTEEALFERFRGAYPYRELERETFDEVVEMVARGYATRRGRRGAYLHHDAVNRRLRPRKGARLSALTSGGAIPDSGDFRVLLEPGGTFIGTLNEDFAVESLQGDIFQLGNRSWRILKVETGVVRVADAEGEPPNIPFWLGEAPARSDELSARISELRREVGRRLPEPDDGPAPAEALEAGGRNGGPPSGDGSRSEPFTGEDVEPAIAWLGDELGLSRPAAFQIAAYLGESKRLLGAVPTQETIVLERFFDEAGGMQLVLHAPFGSRVNRAWGLALRKRFCRKFNFELQAAATEDAVLLSLGPQHSFPLEEVFRYLKPGSLRGPLVQALLDAPMFQIRWRWVATISLAVLRRWGGKRVPPQIQRMQSEDLLSAVFPDAVACLEHVAGAREIPDHPLTRQVIRDCLQEVMDLDGLTAILERVLGGEIRCIGRDSPEPSPLSHEILTAAPYAFLDDGEAEERRVQAVRTRRALEPSSAEDLGALDASAIERVREEVRPEPESADELHDALLVGGFLTEGEGEAAGWTELRRTLADEGRAARVMPAGAGGALWVAAERLPEARAVFPDARVEPAIELPERLEAEATGREAAIRELLRGRVEMAGPVTAVELGDGLGIGEDEARRALLALESEGVVLRGSFTPGGAPGEDTSGAGGEEWCDRRLLARIHRYTLKRLRAEIRPVSAADFMRFLFRWQRVAPGERVAGTEGLATVLEQLDGFELPAAAWEPDVLAARCEDYEPEHLDRLCVSGRVRWARLSPPPGADGGDSGDGAGSGAGLATTGPLRSSPVALFLREHAAAWRALSAPAEGNGPEPSTHGAAVLEALDRRGASFFPELVEACGLLPTQVERALGELAAFGLVTSDSFAGLRALLTPSDRRKPLGRAGRGTRGRKSVYGVDTAGRWSRLAPPEDGDGAAPPADGGGRASGAGHAGSGRGEGDTELFARILLRRYGVVFRRLLRREAHAPAWRDLLLAYRRLEARGEVRGGRFVAGFSGEQFALPEAVGRLRAVRREDEADEPLIAVSAADPLNLTGIVTPGDRVPAVATNRVLYRAGVPVAARQGGEVRRLADAGASLRDAEVRPGELRRALRRSMPPSLRRYLGRTG